MDDQGKIQGSDLSRVEEAADLSKVEEAADLSRVEEAADLSRVEEAADLSKVEEAAAKRRILRYARAGLVFWANAFLVAGMMDGIWNVFDSSALFFAGTGAGLFYTALTDKWPKISGND